jgi:hypothetical protein
MIGGYRMDFDVSTSSTTIMASRHKKMNPVDEVSFRDMLGKLTPESPVKQIDVIIAAALLYIECAPDVVRIFEEFVKNVSDIA